jgi:peptidoglycan/LPS O-acetylase OafA/YrhL
MTAKYRKLYEELLSEKHYRQEIRSNSKQKLEFIDSLREIASLTVIVFHLVFIPQPKLLFLGTLDKFIHVSGSRVILFFVISAFTLYMSADNSQQESKKKIKI